MASPMEEYMQHLTSAFGASVVFESDNAAGHRLPEPKPARMSDEEIIALWLQTQKCPSDWTDEDSEGSCQLERWETLEGLVSEPPSRPSRFLSSDSMDSLQWPIRGSPCQAHLPLVGDTGSPCRSPKRAQKHPPRMPLRQASYTDRNTKSMGPVAA